MVPCQVFRGKKLALRLETHVIAIIAANVVLPLFLAALNSSSENLLMAVRGVSTICLAQKFDPRGIALDHWGLIVGPPGFLSDPVPSPLVIKCGGQAGQYRPHPELSLAMS